MQSLGSRTFRIPVVLCYVFLVWLCRDRAPDESDISSMDPKCPVVVSRFGYGIRRIQIQIHIGVVPVSRMGHGISQALHRHIRDHTFKALLQTPLTTYILKSINQEQEH
jgi:hypothetical protein